MCNYKYAACAFCDGAGMYSEDGSGLSYVECPDCNGKGILKVKYKQEHLAAKINELEQRLANAYEDDK